MLNKAIMLSKTWRWHAKYVWGAKYCTIPLYRYPCKEDEYTTTPQYPPLEKTEEFLGEKKQKEWYEKIKRQPTVEEKLFEVNVPRYYGWKCFMVYEGVIPFNNLVFSQHMTRTHLIRTETLPDFYSASLKKSSNLAKEIASSVVESIEYQLHIK